MQPDQDYNQNSEQKGEAKEYPLYNYDYPANNEVHAAPYAPAPEVEEDDYAPATDYADSEKTKEELLDENQDLRKDNEALGASVGTLRTLAIVFGVVSALSIGYILFSHLKAPLFGPVAAEHKQFLAQTDELKKVKSKADTLQKANDMLVEQQPEIEDGVFFEVQLGAFQDFNLDDYQAELASLRQDGDVTRKFTFGRFRDYRRAEKLKNDLQRMGVGGAFVVARINGQRTEDIQAALKASQAR